MTVAEAERYSRMADVSARANGWTNSATEQASVWFGNDEQAHDFALDCVPLQYEQTQEAYEVHEDDMEQFAINLEEYANTADFTVVGSGEVNWEELAEYLYAVVHEGE